MFEIVMLARRSQRLLAVLNSVAGIVLCTAAVGAGSGLAAP
ncbi:hypothetical protein [Rhodococcus koreensis]